MYGTLTLNFSWDGWGKKYIRLLQLQ